MLHFSDPLTDWRKELSDLRKNTTVVSKPASSSVVPPLQLSLVSRTPDPVPAALSERNTIVPNTSEVAPVNKISPRACEYYDQENVDPNSGICLYGLDTEAVPHDPEFKKFLSAMKLKEKVKTFIFFVA
jgi:hypothetical protein